ncbi:hypothetical protein [Lysobacter sp. CA199]|uniref:hypothetical protein n=1 Tax=Lysobacter sp. CA199 TaxID=3455608 RepID=UPI003F8D05BA
MTFAQYTIAPVDGALHGFECALRPGMPIHHVPRHWPGEDRVFEVDALRIAERIARVSREHNGALAEATLRFEAARLASLSLCLTPREHRGLDEAGFYASVQARLAVHRRWLRTATGVAADPVVASWGRMGVLRDKSEGVYVCLRWSPATDA